MDAPNMIHALRVAYERLGRSLNAIWVLQLVQSVLLFAITWKVFWG